MNTAWEITTDDVDAVLKSHGKKVSEADLDKIHEQLDHESIIDGLLTYSSMDVQISSMLSDIEDHLISTAQVQAPKMFVLDEDFSDEFDEVDEDHEG